ncbi:MAG: RsmB/NOP family class I SAM-dependent RNA methyltransferase [Streptosporangiaceae bacterium]
MAGTAANPGGPGTGRRPQSRSRADPARRAACDVLCAVAARDAYANLLLSATLAERRLSGRDAALATELTYGTLRGQGTYDAVLAICSDRDLGGLELGVREILRLGTHQLLATRVSPHAAVATSVDLVRDVVGQRAAGFVNAILRRVATRDLAAWLDIAAPSRDENLVGHLAVRHSHPQWIVTAVSEALGEMPGETPGPPRRDTGALAGGSLATASLPETEAMLAADNERPRVTLCAAPGLTELDELAESGASPARWSKFGAYLADGDPARVPAVAQGRAGVQDEASQLAAVALTRVTISGRDTRWLDLCAGPGGKARLLAGLAERSGARLVAAELRPHRARLVRSAMAGSHAAQSERASVIVADGTRPAWRAGSFDRVIADVPCTGLGALRRRPEARWRRSPETIAGLREVQQRLLGTALESVRPGGVVAYVTCSPHLAETRAVLAAVLPGCGDIEILDAPGVLAEVPGLACPGPDSRYAQFWPHRHGTDAIFLALLRRAPVA